MEYVDLTQKTFFTPEQVCEEHVERVGTPRGRLLIAGCRSGSHLSRQVADTYEELLQVSGSDVEVPHLEDVDFRFGDEETGVRLEVPVSGHDVFLFQALQDPTVERDVDQNYMAFLIAVRAFKEHGASHVTGVLPYLAYARQDRPTRFRREPTTAKLMADVGIEAGIDRLITWHPHTRQIHGFYARIPLDAIESLMLFTEEFERFAGRGDVIAVAPDVGASKFVTYFGRALSLRSAVASKYRLRPEEAVISELIGNFEGRRIAIVLDDMVSSGATVHSVIQKLVEDKHIEEVYLGVSHNLCTERAYERLTELHEAYNLKQVVVTNSIPQTEKFTSLSFFTVRDLAEILARVINRVHYSRSVSELFMRTE